ncbi:MAG: GC-type dockerin domain-anchored protein [Phycisphaerales bacterium JB040]
MTRQMKITALVAVCGGAAGIANAQSIVTGTGATLQEAFFRSPASTNDYIDVDGDGTAGSLGSFAPDQLAPQGGDLIGDPANPDLYWIFHYRINGSGNGIRELDYFGDVFGIPQLVPAVDIANPDGQDTRGDGVLDNNDPGNVIYTDLAIWNRRDLIDGVGLTAIGDVDHLSGAPFLPISGTYAPGRWIDGDTVGFNADFAASDVPLSWFAIQPGVNSPTLAPSTAGYGGNPRRTTALDGSGLESQTNLLRDLNRLNTNTASPNNATVYSTSISIAPVAAWVNYGVGLQEAYMSDLRHLEATGRMMSGENLMSVVRDSGSGTRNTFQNGVGLDPSWGRGENAGPRTTTSTNDRLGPNFIPSQKGGSSRVDGTVANHRLAIGHSGAERGISSGLLTNKRSEVLAIRSDLKGGTLFVRPTQQAVLDGGPNGYNIVGPAAVSHIGDPRNAPASDGGWGWLASETGPTPYVDGSNNPNPTPPNPAVSEYLNNITRSIAGFVAIPGGLETEFMPGEVLAQQYLLVAAPDRVPGDPGLQANQPIAIVANTSQNAAVRALADVDPNAALNDPLYDTFDDTVAGRVPFRTESTVYTDGNAGSHYVTHSAGVLNYGDPMNMRNKIAYDFNGDGARTTADAADMWAAYQDRQGGASWIPSDGDGSASIEILGDGTGDGNFTLADLRYWADGLVLSTAAGIDCLPVQGSDTNSDNIIDTFTIGDGVVEATLDRTAGFTALDNAAGGNAFGTTLVTGTYDAGDSRADVAGPSTVVSKDANGNVTGVVGATPGYIPQGADGTVDAFDIDYVCANFGDWCDVNQAVNMDLSCDMNGDLVVDGADVDAIVVGILDSEKGDVNLDGVRDATDVGIVTGNLGMMNASYSDGDLDCDGDVDEADLFIAEGCSKADFAADGILDNGDIGAFVSAFLAGNIAADINGDGILDNGDIGAFVALFLACV